MTRDMMYTTTDMGRPIKHVMNTKLTIEHLWGKNLCLNSVNFIEGIISHSLDTLFFGAGM